MKTAVIIFSFSLFLLAGMQKAKAQTKTETLDWLRINLKSVVIHNNDSILPYTMTKTYTFYDDNFVVKTVKDFEDKDLNGAPAFSKIFYKNIIPEKDIVFQDEHPDGINVFTITANPVYFIIGKEDAPLSFWQHFNEPSGLDLYLPEDKELSREAVKRLMLLAETKESAVAAYPDTIQKDYKMLESIINQQKFPFPATMGYRIKATLKNIDKLTILESRPNSVREYTLKLHRLQKFTLLPDTTGYNKDAVHFVLKMKDSVLVASTNNNHKTQYTKQRRVTFTLGNPHLIAEAETLLTNIRRDNDRREKWNETKKLQATY